jgi:hypothetical protein
MSGFRNKLMLAGTIAALGVGALGTASVAQAKHGADDPVGHNAGDDRGGLRAHTSRHGADDPAGDDRGGRRVHARASRHGRDDGPGDDRRPR